MFKNYFAKDIGVDLGTTNSLVYVKGRGIVIDEPTLAAVNIKTNQILVLGEEARKMLGRTPAHINVVKPLIGGVISDFEISQAMLQNFFKKLNGGKIFGYYRVIIGIPANLTEVERKSVEDAALSAGAAKVYLVEQPLAASLGARLPIHEPSANMIVDIGGGTTDIAIISMGGVVVTRTLKVAGEKLTSDIMQFMRDEFRLAIGELTASELKTTIGTAIPTDDKMKMEVRGRDMATGLPKEVVVKENHVRSAIGRSLQTMVEAMQEVIESAPPELAGDILRRGVYVCGGGSLLRGIDKLIEKELAVPVFIADDPMTCVVRGTGIIAENIRGHSHLISSSSKPVEINL